MIGALGRGMLDLFYPPRCEACGALRHPPICPTCDSAIVMLHPPLCERCGQPFDPQAQTGPLCMECRTEKRPSFTIGRSAAFYEGPLVQLIWRYKYECQMVLAKPLGQLLVKALAESAAGLDPVTIDILCAVPLHPSRRRERGFNQSELLAEQLATALEKPLLPLLERTRATRPQVDLPRQSRAANVRGAFAVTRMEEVRGKCILLIDDLFTTGATIQECARVLQGAGAAEVRVLTLARPISAWRRPGVDARRAQARVEK